MSLGQLRKALQALLVQFLAGDSNKMIFHFFGHLDKEVLNFMSPGQLRNAFHALWVQFQARGSKLGTESNIGDKKCAQINMH